MANRIICLMGPTASGKSALSYELANHFPIEVVSIDSAMIYREMNIGTAKPDESILKEIPHHLIDILNPDESTSVAAISSKVEDLVEEIKGRGKIPLLVGGTLMYFRAMQDGLSVLPSTDEKTRAYFSELALTKGWTHMYQLLMEKDAVTASKIHPHDTQRIQRALEVAELTNTPLSELLKNPRAKPKHQWVHVAILPSDRAWLHERIAMRFRAMLAEGLVDEVEELLKKWSLRFEHASMRSVGYRQVMLYLQGEYDYPTFVEKGIIATRQLAKRQLTWLRHWPNLRRLRAEGQDTLQEMKILMQSIEDRNDE